MSQIQLNVKTMSSIEIVKLINDHRMNTEKEFTLPTLRHSDFLAKVPNVLGAEYSEKFRSTYLANNGKENPCYRFEKREACLMAMSYSYELQAIVFDRMTELEDNYKKNVVKLPNFEDPAEAAIAWAAEYKAKQLAQEQLQLAAPKVQYFDMVADVDNYMNATTVGQKFGMSATVLNRHLEQLNVYNRTIKQGRVFQQWFIDKGLGVMKKTDNGYNQSRFTNKGEQWIIEKLTGEWII